MPTTLKELADYYLADSIRIDEGRVEVCFKGEVRKEQVARAESIVWELGMAVRECTLVVAGQKITRGTEAAARRMEENGVLKIRLRPGEVG